MLDQLALDVTVGKLACCQIHLLSNMFATGVKIKTTGELKLTDSPLKLFTLLSARAQLKTKTSLPSIQI